MIRLKQRGFTLVELLIGIGILGIATPLLALALFQILTFTERGRAGFEAQADTRNASTWISQDIVMAQGTNLIVINPPDPTEYIEIEDPDCADAETEWATFTWTDYFEDRNDQHTVSYCLFDSLNPPADPSPFPECRTPGICLVRSFSVIDSENNPTSGGSIVIARNIASVEFEAHDDSEIKVKIKSAPENRFGVVDEKNLRVLMRSTA